jgi:hypothetical protein
VSLPHAPSKITLRFSFIWLGRRPMRDSVENKCSRESPSGYLQRKKFLTTIPLCGLTNPGPHLLASLACKSLDKGSLVVQCLRQHTELLLRFVEAARF